MSKRVLILTCAATFLLAACSDTNPGDVSPGSGPRFIPMVVDFADDAGLGNAVTVDKDGNPFLSYFIFPAEVKANEIPITRPIGTPYITTAAANGKASENGAAVGVASLSSDGVWTRGAAAQVRDTPSGVTIPYGPATEPSLVGATPANTNGTDIALDATGGKHVVWTGKDGVYYGYGPATGSFAVERLYDYGYGGLRLAGPIGRASVAVDAKNVPWVAYALVTQKLEIRVATKAGSKWTTDTVASLPLCSGCAQPGPTQIGVTPKGPVVAYVDPSTKTLYAATKTGAGWTVATVTGGVTGGGLDLAVGKDGKVYLSYYDGKGAVDLSVGDGTAWSTSKVADAAPASPAVVAGGAASSPSASPAAPLSLATGNFAQTTGVAVDDNGTLYVSYYDGATDSVVLSSGDGTTFTPVATTATVDGQYPSVAVSPDGAFVYMAWYGVENQDLRMGIQGDVQDLPIAAPSPTPSGGVAPPSGPTCGADGKVALDISAQNIAFDTNCLVADAGTNFTVNFDNKDTGVTHNFDLYTAQGGDSLASTQLAAGPVVQKLPVKPLDAGTYFFQCDAHPTSMFGQFVVVKGKGK